MGKWSTEQWTLRTWAWESAHWTGAGTAQLKYQRPGDELRPRQERADERRPQQLIASEYRPSAKRGADEYHTV